MERRADSQGTPGALINPGAICPNLEVSGKTHQSLDKRKGRERRSRGQIHSPKGAFHRPHLYQQPDQSTFAANVYLERGLPATGRGGSERERDRLKVTLQVGAGVWIRDH